MGTSGIRFLGPPVCKYASKSPPPWINSRTLSIWTENAGRVIRKQKVVYPGARGGGISWGREEREGGGFLPSEPRGSRLSWSWYGCICNDRSEHEVDGEAYKALGVCMCALVLRQASEETPSGTSTPSRTQACGNPSRVIDLPAETRLQKKRKDFFLARFNGGASVSNRSYR